MAKRRKTRQHRFSRNPQPRVPRSAFQRDSQMKTAIDAGWLYPVWVDEALPGDTVSLRTTSFGRLATPLFPVMENLFLEFFFFAVPCRLLWQNWAKFMGEQEKPGDSTDYSVPQVVSHPSLGFITDSLYDHMGLPTSVPSLSVSALPLRAYNWIWNEWFRDQNLQDPVSFENGDGPDDPTIYQKQRRGKRHDYFTSSLPWAQKGEAVQLPLGGQAPVTVDGGSSPTFDTPSGSGPFSLWSKPAGSNDQKTDAELVRAQGDTGDDILNERLLWDEPNLTGTADLTNATAITVNELRETIALQHMLEQDARGGTRLQETIQNFFGVDPGDGRMQRPELLGLGRQMVQINPIAQTSETTGASNTPQGHLAAIGTTMGSGSGFMKSFTEHCVLLGVCALRADLNYQQGVDRHWLRKSRWDYYWPPFANLGEQEVFNAEIYAQGADKVDPETEKPWDELPFGYQERWSEYRYKRNHITSTMRSNVSGGSLDSWHLAQYFDALPKLNADFIEENPPMQRILAVPSERHMILDVFFKQQHVRPIPVRSVPGLHRL